MISELNVTGEPTNLEEKLNTYVQNTKPQFSELARQISELIRIVNRGINQDGTSNSFPNLMNEIARYAKLDFPSFYGSEDILSM